MSDNNYITIRAIEVEQPIGRFYIGAMDWTDLLAISYVDIRHLESRELDKYLGIQRELSRPRLEKLRRYVRTVDASFPTSVILALSSEHAVYNEKVAAMAIRRDGRVAKVIDGQHRMAGLQALQGASDVGPFMVNVTMFVDMDIEDQANVFATINLAQTRVGKSLAYDLSAYEKARSPQKTCHEIARLLNRKEGSPFLGRIKVLGRATPGSRTELLTQAAFIERLLPYLSVDPPGDRDLLKRERPLPETPTELRDKLIFREFFRKDQDQFIVTALWNYFSAVERRWPEAWGPVESGMILNRTTGYAALMRFLRPAYCAHRGHGVPTQQYFNSVLARIDLKNSDFTSERFPPGGSGEAALAKELLDQSGIARAQAG